LPRILRLRILVEQAAAGFTIGRFAVDAHHDRQMNKTLPISLLVAALTLSGCTWAGRHMPWHHDTASQPTQASPQTASPNNPAPAPSRSRAPIMTLDNSLTATVLRVNATERYVVLNFPDGRMPKLNQHLYLYRNGLKTAEVNVAGPQDETTIVADLVSGDAQVGDTVRDQ
jgi:hypothetical protein